MEAASETGSTGSTEIDSMRYRKPFSSSYTTFRIRMKQFLHLVRVFVGLSRPRHRFLGHILLAYSVKFFSQKDPVIVRSARCIGKPYTQTPVCALSSIREKLLAKSLRVLSRTRGCVRYWLEQHHLRAMRGQVCGKPVAAKLPIAYADPLHWR